MEDDFFGTNEESLYAQALDQKKDQGSTRFPKKLRRVNLRYVNENTEIPPMPEVKIEKPNDAHYEKLLADLKDKIEKKQKSIEQAIKDIENERYGNNPERENLINLRKQLKLDLNPINEEYNSLALKVKPAKRELKELNFERTELQKELDFKSLDKLNAEIRKIQEKIGYGNIKLTEERGLISQKSKLESQKPKVQRLIQINQQIEVLKEQNKASLDRYAVLETMYNKKWEEIGRIDEKIDKIYQEKKDNEPRINNLVDIKKSLIKDKNNLIEERYKVEKEWNDKWYAFDEYKSTVDYITKAQKIKDEALKSIEKKKKAEEKRAKKEAKKVGEAGTEQPLTTEAGEGVQPKISKTLYRVDYCNWLINFFEGLEGINKPRTETTDNNQPKVQADNSKLNNDIKKGVLKEISHDETEDLIGIGGKSTIKPKNMSKGGKLGKKQEKESKSNLLSLDISVIAQIKDIGLVPPVQKVDVQRFLDTLKKRLVELKNEEAGLAGVVSSSTVTKTDAPIVNAEVQAPRVNTDVQAEGKVDATPEVVATSEVVGTPEVVATPEVDATPEVVATPEEPKEEKKEAPAKVDSPSKKRTSVKKSPRRKPKADEPEHDKLVRDLTVIKINFYFLNI